MNIDKQLKKSESENNLNIANIRPDLLLEGEKPRLIDEWQDAPTIWDAIRYDVDKTGLECDAIIHLHSGKWGAVEIKLGSDEAINEAAKSLLKFRDIVDTEVMNKPSFLMVLTATKYAYKREDGVYVVPIGCLKN